MGACYAFVQKDTFSGCNPRLRAALDTVLAPLRAEVIDVWDRRRIGRGVVLNVPPANLLPMVREFGRLGLRDPKAFLESRSATTYMFDHASTTARRQVQLLQPEFVLQTQTLFNARDPGRPFYIYTDHTVLANQRYPVPPAGQWPPGWVERERETYLACDHIFTSSEFARRSLLEDYGCEARRLTVVGSGVNTRIPDKPPVRRGPGTTVLFVGFNWKRKGGPELLRAFRAARRRHPRARLIVVGARPKVQEPGVEVRGRVPLATVERLLAEADIFCMPSHVEPSAGVYLEAAAFGLPIVATTVGGTPERVIDGVNGLLCRPGDAAALEDCLLRLMASAEERARLGRAGWELVRERSTWPIVAEKIAHVIRSRAPVGADSPGSARPGGPARRGAVADAEPEAGG